MGWERRSTRSSYYYLSHRVAGRVRKTYVGKGPIAELAIDRILERQAARRAERESVRAERERLAQLERTMAVLDEGCRSLLAVVLTGAGYHQHARGVWRRRRVRKPEES